MILEPEKRRLSSSQVEICDMEVGEQQNTSVSAIVFYFQKQERRTEFTFERTLGTSEIKKCRGCIYQFVELMVFL